jgi:hypothetical protein
LSMSMCAAMAAPALGPNPVMTFTTPAGKPAFLTSSASFRAVIEVCSAGCCYIDEQRVSFFLL